MDKYAFFLDIDGTLSKSGVIHPDNKILQIPEYNPVL